MFKGTIDDYHSIRIIFYLQENSSIRSAVYAYASNSPAVAKKRIDDMIRAGVITENEEPFPPKRKWLKLTKKGERVAEHLLAIQRILSE